MKRPPSMPRLRVVAMIIGLFVGVHMLGVLLLLDGFLDGDDDPLDAEVKKLREGSGPQFLSAEAADNMAASDIFAYEQGVVTELDPADVAWEKRAAGLLDTQGQPLSAAERYTLITVLVTRLHMARAFLHQQRDAVLQEMTKRYLHAGYTSQAAEEPVLAPADLTASTSLRQRIIASLHQKTHQALPELLQSSDAELLGLAALFRQFHSPPFGGSRQEQHRHGLPVKAQHLYETRFFKEYIPAGHMYQNLLALLTETMIIYRLTGIQFFLMHDALLGWYRSRSLLPWSRTLMLGIQEKDLEELEAFSKWWKNDETEVWVNFLSASRLPGSASEAVDAKLINKRNGCFISITALTMTHPRNLPSRVKAQMVPTRVSNSTLHDKFPNIYNVPDIFPLVPTRLAKDIVIFRPQHVENVLRQEYGDEPLVQTTWGSYSWDPVLTDWVQGPAHFLYAPPLSKKIV